MKGKINERCPLQEECERRKCEYRFNELECEYYANNGVGDDRTIPDQEEKRSEIERRRYEEACEAAHDEIDDDPSEDEEKSGTGGLVYIPVKDLHQHPDNPRKDLGDLTELADSIKANGIFQNLTVVPAADGYTLIIGHRRRAAAELAGLTELPCIIVNMTPMEQLQTMMLENMQRSDLTVYEQAQGFQLMIKLGDTIDGIAEKTGFSKTTINRRLKMAELDQPTLKEVSSRQILLSDFDRLAQIEDMEERNDCLQHIGTANFNMEVERRLKKQNVTKNMPAVKSALRAAKAKKIERSQTWDGEYEEITGARIAIDKLDNGKVSIPKSTEDLFYYIDEYSEQLRFYKKRKKSAPVKRSQEEIDREKAMQEANARCTEISELCKKLRMDFVKTLSLTSKNRDAMLRGAVSAIISLSFKYGSPSSSKMFELAGIERTYSGGKNEKVIAELMKRIDETAPSVIYAAFCDENEYYHTRYIRQFPRHQNSSRLDALYDWLCSVGYEMSDEEKTMQDGTHELLNLGDA